ncbi:MAG: hypothetical protein JRN21_09665 [Nitrososphaerota archaeon]|nr:hypothetical protein [Nitrososphaerota archaeon]
MSKKPAPALSSKQPDQRNLAYEGKYFMIDNNGEYLMLLTYGPHQVKQLITEFQNIDEKKHLSEEKRVQAFIDRLYRGGFIVVNLSKAPLGVISNAGNHHDKQRSTAATT